MYVLYCNEHAIPAGQLDTSATSAGWRVLSTHTHRRHILSVLGKIASFQPCPWKRFRVFHHPKQSVIGRLTCEGEIARGHFTLKGA